MTGSSSLKGKQKIDEDEVRQERAEEERQQEAPHGEIEVAQSRKNEEVDGKSEVGEVGGKLEVGEASSSSKGAKLHICRFCDKTFPSAQALGGHMNCHKIAREQELIYKALGLINGRSPQTLYRVMGGRGVTFPNPPPMEQIPRQPSIAHPPHAMFEADVDYYPNFDEQNILPPQYNSMHTQHSQIPYPVQFGQFEVPSGQFWNMTYGGTNESGEQSQAANEHQSNEQGWMVMGPNDGIDPAQIGTSNALGYTGPAQGAPGYTNLAQAGPSYTNRAQGTQIYAHSNVASTSQIPEGVQLQENSAQQLRRNISGRRPIRSDLGSSPPEHRQLQHHHQQQHRQQNLQHHRQQQQSSLQQQLHHQQQLLQEQQQLFTQECILDQPQNVEMKSFHRTSAPASAQNPIARGHAQAHPQVPDKELDAQEGNHVDWRGFLNDCGSGAPGFDESSQHGQGGSGPSNFNPQ